MKDASTDYNPESRLALLLYSDGRLDTWNIEAFGADGWASAPVSSRSQAGVDDVLLPSLTVVHPELTANTLDNME